MWKALQRENNAFVGAKIGNNNKGEGATLGFQVRPYSFESGTSLVGIPQKAEAIPPKARGKEK